MTRPTLNDVTNASLSALVKALGAFIAILFLLQLIMAFWIFQSLNTMRSIDSTLRSHVETPPQTIIIEE